MEMPIILPMGDFLDKVIGLLTGPAPEVANRPVWSEEGICAPEDLPLDQEKPGTTIKALADADVPPDIFLIEDGPDRFQSITHCSPERQDALKIQMSLASYSVTNRSPEAIAGQLESLYAKAYQYDPKTRLMGVVDPEAKQQLDLWIAAINHRAHDDEAFLDSVHTPRIEKIIALNSEKMTEKDRGAFHEWIGELRSSKEIFVEGTNNEFQWLDTYDGNKPWLEVPFIQSAHQYYLAAKAHCGIDKLYELFRNNFPQKALTEALRKRGLEDRYAYLNSLSDKELIARQMNLFDIVDLKATPEMMRQLAIEMILISYVANEHGKALEDIARNYNVDILKRGGYKREDAELLVRNGQISSTTSRLDDYQARFEVLGKFREIYTDFISAPIEEKFSPSRSARYNLWGQWALNRSITQVPIRLSDLDQVRREVHEELSPETDGAISWWDLQGHDTSVPLWLKPEEIGRYENPCLDPLAWSQEVYVGDKSLADFARRNVDYIAILPKELMPSTHALGVAYLLFGAIVINGEGRRSPASFLRTYAHEAMHLHYARANFDNHPERLSWMAADERLSYMTGMDIAEQYLDVAFPDVTEQLSIEETIEFQKMLVTWTNERLGLHPDDMSFKYADPAWEKESPPFLSVQPADFLGRDGKMQGTLGDFSDQLTAEAMDAKWAELLTVFGGVQSIPLSDLNNALTISRKFQQLRADELSPTYHEGHPAGMFVNWLLRLGGGQSAPYITLDQKMWEQIKKNAVAAALSRDAETKRVQAARAQHVAEKWPELLAYLNETLPPEEVAQLHELWKKLDKVDQRGVYISSRHPLHQWMRAVGQHLGVKIPQRGFDLWNEEQWQGIKGLLVDLYRLNLEQTAKKKPSITH